MQCPKCSSEMIKRYSPKTKNHFWGCSQFPRCKGILPYTEDGKNGKGLQPINRQLKQITTPSQYQKAIFDFVESGSGNAIVMAAAGSGKTTTIEHVVGLIRRLNPSADIVYTVFNAHVRREALEKGLPALTTHQLGLRAINSSNAGAQVKIDDNKVKNIVKNMLERTWEVEKWMLPIVCDIVAKFKNTFVPVTFQQFEEIVERFGMEVNGSAERIFELAKLALEQSNKMLTVVDFDDMIYLPVKMKMNCHQYDWVLTDESQDFNRAQILLIQKSLKPGGRLIAVGDENQSMYGFRGADLEAMGKIKEAFNAVELPLSISYRCPKSHVQLVNQLFPEIPFEVFSEAKEGTINEMSIDMMLGSLKAGDLVLSRINSNLVAPVFTLIRAGKKAIIRGRNIGEGLINLVEKFKVQKTSELVEKLTEYEEKEVSKLMAQDKGNQAEVLKDRIDTIFAIADDTDWVSQIVTKIREVFSDDNVGIVFSTVHKAKGDEANNVYILDPHLMPSKYAKKQWEQQQERNIAYVAMSRSKENLTFVRGSVPVQFGE